MLESQFPPPLPTKIFFNNFLLYNLCFLFHFYNSFNLNNNNFLYFNNLFPFSFIFFSFIFLIFKHDNTLPLLQNLHIYLIELSGILLTLFRAEQSSPPVESKSRICLKKKKKSNKKTILELNEYAV